MAEWTIHLPAVGPLPIVVRCGCGRDVRLGADAPGVRCVCGVAWLATGGAVWTREGK